RAMRAPRSADQFVEGVLIGGGVPELGHHAVAEMEDVTVIGLDAPAVPARPLVYQRHAALIVREHRLQIDVERSLCALHELAEEAIYGVPAAVFARQLI